MAENMDLGPRWGRPMEEETPYAFHHFCIYRDMGPGRSLQQLANITGKHLTNYQTWSRRYEWVDRAHAWDAYLEMVKRSAVEEELKKASQDDVRKREALNSYNIETERLASEEARRIIETIHNLPLIRQRVIESYEDGRERVVIQEPAVSSLDLAAQRLYRIGARVGSRDAQISGDGVEEDYGQDLAALERDFEAMIREQGRESNGRE